MDGPTRPGRVLQMMVCSLRGIPDFLLQSLFSFADTPGFLSPFFVRKTAVNPSMVESSKRGTNDRQTNYPGQRLQHQHAGHQQDIRIQLPMDIALTVFDVKLSQSLVRVYTLLPQLFITAGDIQPLHRFTGPPRQFFIPAAILDTGRAGTVIEYQQFVLGMRHNASLLLKLWQRPGLAPLTFVQR